MASLRALTRSCAKRFRVKRTYAYSQYVNQSVWTSENIVKSPYKDIVIPNRTVADHIWENLERWSDKTAVVCGVTNQSVTYHELYKFSQRFGAQLRTKFRLTDGDVVCIMMNNVPDYASVLLGAIEAGAEVTTVNPTYTPYEVQRQILISDPKVLIGTPDSIPILREALKLAKKDLPIISCGPKSGLPPGTVFFDDLINDNHANLDILREVKKNNDDVVLLPYSSGTTGLPKGVELSHKNLVANFLQQDEENMRHYDETTGSNQDSVLGVLPFYHIYGIAVVLLHKLSVGCKVVSLPKFHPNLLINAMNQHDLSLIYAAPPLVLFLGSHDGVKSKHLASVKRITCGAAPLPRADIDNVLAKTTNTQFLQVYGLTETAPLVTTFERGSTKYTTAGKPVPSTEIRIVNPEGKILGPNEVGELQVRGPQVMKGYRNNAEATNNVIIEGGWFKTGDLSSIDHDGSLTISDRLKELIKVKGYQVPPAELENVIKEHPDVLDAGVIGIPDPKSGEIPKAFVVLKEGRNADAENIKSFVAERVAAYKRLKQVVFLESLPKNPSGKLLRRVLKNN